MRTLTPPPEASTSSSSSPIRFTDDRGLGNPASIPFFVTDGTGRWTDIDADCGVGARVDPRGTACSSKDDEATGNACFTVPVDAVDGLVLGTEGFSGPLYFALPA